MAAGNNASRYGSTINRKTAIMAKKVKRVTKATGKAKSTAKKDNGKLSAAFAKTFEGIKEIRDECEKEFEHEVVKIYNTLHELGKKMLDLVAAKIGDR